MFEVFSRSQEQETIPKVTQDMNIIILICCHGLNNPTIEPVFIESFLILVIVLHI